MALNVFVPVLSYDQLRDEAARFLRTYHPSGSVPIPIEEIVDLQLKIDIIPTPGLLDNFDVDAFITSDMESIYVDEFIYRSRRSRYRFTLAHEIAHAVLHQKAFRALSFDSIDSWKGVQQKMSDEQHAWLEFQARAFAGYALVPPDALKTAFQRARSKAIEAGISIDRAGEGARQIVADALAREFDVSREVMSRRLDKDGLWNC